MKPKTKRKVLAISKLIWARQNSRFKPVGMRDLSRTLLPRSIENVAINNSSCLKKDMLSGLLAGEKLKNLKKQLHLVQKNTSSFIKEHRTIKILHIFRNYSALIVVISSALLVSATNFTAGRESSGFLFGYLGENDNYDSPLKDRMSLLANKNTNVALAPLAEASTAPDPKLKEEENDALITQGQALEAGTCPVKKDPEEDGGVIIYEVKDGDTVSAIASKNNITINTILWANELGNVDEIMPGDKIFILPVSGLTYTVKTGDTIDDIAKEYKAERDKIIAFNELPANGELKVGEGIVIPGGEKEVPQTQITTPPAGNSGIGIAERPYESFGSTGRTPVGKAGSGHSFPYGYCTWYVAQKRYVPWGGNAGTWLYHAKSMGYATGRAPRVGSIMVSSESWWGHVGIVEKVSGSTITISEMNYAGWGKKSSRTLDSKSRVVKGFIY